MPNQVAIYWDLQNVHPSLEQVLSQVLSLYCFAQKFGRITLKNVCAHWRRESPKIENIFYNLGFNCPNAPAGKGKKNNADKKLIEDCLQDVRHNPEISTVFLVSGDKDFIPLVLQLKERNIQVILIIRSDENTKPELKNIVDKFYYLDWIEKEFGSPCFDPKQILSLIN
ncbi:NYN domain-containing protein [Laspinema sp. D1]|uniref:NYN domain-containing protein n=1 Tax=Laspinema palackyanum D2a TaxID=2953684 RepID=A0ABT2MJA8_9CYAN|nr:MULTISPECIES: NYN domain-containing protein [unclassified Laspinema]MCT7964824.1 NYN domain-containing protein [Laspinema sp. D2a]MCT7971438.1 NYN domain-containing protein [Laspinema sp. D3d]MCT7987307.1 NYN domain-containing protein [Laspinema sp. D3a]